MKTVFVVNPKAGKRTEEFIRKIEKAVSERSENAEIYFTKAPKDATRFVREYLENKGVARFIACGGDGTLSEVINGIIGFPDSEIGVIPIGTGNDFVRSFGKDCDFFNIPLLMDCKTQKTDLIKYEMTLGDILKEGCCVNMSNIGFDCNVADLTNRIKERSIVKGSLAYIVSIFISLIRKKCTDLKIETEDGVIYDGKLLLTSLANGSYCGGGIMSNPLASLNDGLININIIKNVSRLTFLSILPHYMKGTFLDLKGIERYLTSPKYKKITITANLGKMKVGIDGEISEAEKAEFSVLENALNFAVPQKAIKETDREYINV